MRSTGRDGAFRFKIPPPQNPEIFRLLTRPWQRFINLNSQIAIVERFERQVQLATS